MKRITMVSAVLFLVLSAGGSLSFAAGDSHVFGRIIGTYQPLPGYFHNNPYMMRKGIRDVEFTGFRLVHTATGETFLIRPYTNGYFHQKLPGGQYKLVRKRTDRPDYRTPKSIDILSFEVRPSSLVNLGTLRIVLDGKPRESLRPRSYSTRGVYKYRYGYERVPGQQAYEKPLNWFRKEKSKIHAGFTGDVGVVEGTPTSRLDGSRVKLRVVVPREDR